MNKKKISKLIKFIPLIIILIGLLITNGPIWIYFALGLWIIFFILFTYLFSNVFTIILTFSIEKFGNFFEKRRKKPKSQLSEKFTIYCNKFNKLMYSFVLPILLTLLLFFTIFNFTNYMAVMSSIKTELNKGEFDQLVNDIVKDKKDNMSKAKAILNWFDNKTGNIFNDWRLRNSYLYAFDGGQIQFYSTYPFIGVRTYNDKDALWILTSRFGHCGEYSNFFRAMADKAGLRVRKACTEGENHCWNEVFINDTIGWKVVDSTAVYLDEGKNGYDNVNRSFMRSRLGGNLSRVEAQEINGIYFNVTAEYTTEVNITVLTVNKENEVIPGVNVKLFSNNREKNGRYTNINGVTNSEGEYTFTIGMGHYTFKASKNDIFGEKSSIFNDEKLPHDITIFME